MLYTVYLISGMSSSLIRSLPAGHFHPFRLSLIVFVFFFVLFFRMSDWLSRFCGVLSRIISFNTSVRRQAKDFNMFTCSLK